MAQPFRQRIFLILVAMTAVPTVLAVAGWLVSVRTLLPTAGARASSERVAASARTLLESVDTLHLTLRERVLLRQHLDQVSASVSPARDRELEAERLRAFREVARWVAHEIKNPLTSMRIAVDQLRRTAGRPLKDSLTVADGRTDTAMQVIDSETDRLERLAKEFADFGRLPEGPHSEVDMVELLDELGRTAVPEGVTVRVSANGGRRVLMGHYDPLRRAFANLLRNAAEAMQGRGAIDVTVTGDGRGLAVTIADHGPGIPDDLRAHVFEPYFTTKTDGTGLGLALVRQALEAHRGTIAVAETPGGGATFAIVFP